MPIQLQGNWTITVQQKSPAALPQRFIISGAQTGNGTYEGFVGITPVYVSGQNWTLNIQANDSYDMSGQWLNSTLRPNPVQIVGPNRVMIIESEDLIQDNSYDDLVLRLSQPIILAEPLQPPVMPPPVVDPYIPPTPPPAFPKIPDTPVQLPAGRVFTLISEEDKLPRQKVLITKGIWSEESGSLLYFFTASSASSSFHLPIYNKQYDSCGAEIQFDIAYGHDAGSGSVDLGGYDYLTQTNAIYSQYRNLCLNPQDRKFKIGNRELTHIYVVNIKQDRMGDRVDEGNIELNLAMLSGSLFSLGGGPRNAHTGSNVKLAGNNQVIRLIDDSKLDYGVDLNAAALSSSYSDINNTYAKRYTEAGPVFYMVSGSLEDGTYQKTNPTVYGLLYPKMGTIILDGDMLDSNVGFLSATGSDSNGRNTEKLLLSISGAANFADASGDKLGFQARKLEYQYCEYYFIRVKNSEYNFTNNPTFQTGSEGLISDNFQTNPKVYITQIGLYNQNKELLAVAKVSQPILKDFTNEGLFCVKLKY